MSDTRSLRVNVSPTNLITRAVAEKHWRRKPTSGLRAWDLVTPDRAGSNTGEFAVLLPGAEQVVLTKEVFVLRVKGGADAGYDPFYLLWCLCLTAVRRQWQRVTLPRGRAAPAAEPGKGRAGGGAVPRLLRHSGDRPDARPRSAHRVVLRVQRECALGRPGGGRAGRG